MLVLSYYNFTTLSASYMNTISLLSVVLTLFLSLEVCSFFLSFPHFRSCLQLTLLRFYSILLSQFNYYASGIINSRIC